jgi:ribosomal protein L37E
MTSTPAGERHPTGTPAGAKAPKAASGPGCRACGNRAYNTRLVAREMMFGRRDRFEYVRCATCGALSLVSVPDDLATYYPPDYYYSFGETPVLKRRGPLVTRAKRARVTVILRTPAPVVDRLVATGRAPVLFGWLAGLGLGRSARIVDVGSGNGALLATFADEGFTNLLGIDPYLEHDSALGPISLRRLAVEDLRGDWDLLMFHHSLEHVLDPVETLRAPGASSRPAAPSWSESRWPTAMPHTTTARTGSAWTRRDTRWCRRTTR